MSDVRIKLGKSILKSNPGTSQEFSQPLSCEWTSDASNKSVVDTLTQKFGKLLPSVKSSLQKGDCGKICIVGGSSVNTGPPFYAGDVALKCGADIVIVVTTPSAAIPLKSYNPTYTVVPFLPEKNEVLSPKFMDRLWPVVKDCQAFCIGPGLGRDKVTLRAAMTLLRKIGLCSLPVVISSGALRLLKKELESPSRDPLNLQSVVILDETEFVQMWASICESDILSWGASVSDAAPVPIDHHCPIASEFSVNEYRHVQAIQQIAVIAGALGSSVAVVQTGFYDVVAQGGGRCFLFGGQTLKKRCSNQGDLLAGLATLFLSWQKLKNEKTNTMDAAYIADVVLRLAILDSCNCISSSKEVSASDVANCIPGVFESIESIFVKESGSSLIYGEEVDCGGSTAHAIEKTTAPQ